MYEASPNWRTGARLAASVSRLFTTWERNALARLRLQGERGWGKGGYVGEEGGEGGLPASEQVARAHGRD